MARGQGGSKVLEMVRGLDGRPPICVVLTGRRPDVRRALEIRLALESDVRVVGSTSSVQTALPALRRLQPHVLLVDVDLAPAIPAASLAAARALVPGLRIVLLTHHRDAVDGAAGADEVVDKSPDAAPLLASIRRRPPVGPQGFV
jgi:DNA-binding NarL/FixJ family response regulator